MATLAEAQGWHTIATTLRHDAQVARAGIVADTPTANQLLTQADEWIGGGDKLLAAHDYQGAVSAYGEGAALSKQAAADANNRREALAQAARRQAGLIADQKALATARAQAIAASQAAARAEQAAGALKAAQATRAALAAQEAALRASQNAAIAAARPKPKPKPTAKPKPVLSPVATTAIVRSGDEVSGIRTVLSVGYSLGAPTLALLAILEIGYGENNWNTVTCNASDHCGVFQLSSALQAEHAYTDVAYWARRAFETGLWIHGGIIENARAHPDWSPGYIANLCQGAYENLDEGANYYNQYLAQARQALGEYGRASSRAGALSQRAPMACPLAHFQGNPERVDQGVDFTAGGGYFSAMGAGTVGYVRYPDPGWEGGGYINYILDSPPFPGGVVIYHAEGVRPLVHHGQHVRAGEAIAQVIPGFHSGTESGFADSTDSDESWARAHGGWGPEYEAENIPTYSGAAFNDILRILCKRGGILYHEARGPTPPYFTELERMASGAPGAAFSLQSPGTGLQVNAMAPANKWNWAPIVRYAFRQLGLHGARASRNMTHPHSLVTGTSVITANRHKGR